MSDDVTSKRVRLATSTEDKKVDEKANEIIQEMEEKGFELSGPQGLAGGAYILMTFKEPDTSDEDEEGSQDD